MNFIWGFMIIISILVSLITGTVDETVNAIFEGAGTAVTTLISFAGAMCFWTGIMRIIQNCGIADFISKLIHPLISLLFPKSSDKAREYIGLNITANLLGMGNAATPLGMMAIEELDSENPTPEKASDNMCMLVVLNTTSFQILPATVIALRAGAGSVSPASVITAIWFTSAFAVITAVTSVKLACKLKLRKKQAAI